MSWLWPNMLCSSVAKNFGSASVKWLWCALTLLISVSFCVPWKYFTALEIHLLLMVRSVLFSLTCWLDKEWFGFFSHKIIMSERNLSMFYHCCLLRGSKKLRFRVWHCQQVQMKQFWLIVRDIHASQRLYEYKGT